MTKTARHQRLIMKRALIGAATLLAVAACSTSTPGGKPAPSSSAPAAGQAGGCEVNPSSAPVPTAEKYEPVPEVGRVSVALSGITSGEVQPGDPPTEVDMAVCNDSPVDYPQVGFVLVLQRCSCATYPSGMARAPSSASTRPPGAGSRSIIRSRARAWITSAHTRTSRRCRRASP